jgi:AraC-like DNA-binding protein
LADLSVQIHAFMLDTLTGQPPLTYLTWWRLTISANLLRESEAPLSEVATRIGYTSEFAFANAFKRQYGTAPGKYHRRKSAEPFVPIHASAPSPEM